ncbi:MAG: hypothetical protein Q8K37_01505, partial [Alphaproteobacteria bacterium]|nr:hypothetical protein [Alphaproteobacteria bacterium]
FLMLAPSEAIIVDYEQAFALEKIHQKYATILNKRGCYENVFEEKYDEDTDIEKSSECILMPIDFPYHPMQMEPYPLIETTKKEKNEFRLYQQECLDRLNKYKNRAALHPALTNGVSLLLISGMTAITIAAMPSNWSFDIMYLSFYSIFLFKEIMPSLFSYFLPHSQILDEYEIEFIKNQCFIPKPLWRPLITQFKLAAQNLSTQDIHLKFIKFALGMRVYQQKKHPKEQLSFKEVINNLIIMLNTYFSKYEHFPEQEMDILGGRIAHYIAQLYGIAPSVTCLHLTGTPGNGKTTFANYLETWFKTNLPKTVYCQRATLLNEKDIEGNEKQSGSFLKAYRDTHIKNANGLFLFCDEIYMSNNDMMNSFKRVFNGNHSIIPTQYFTENGADEFVLPLIPILALFANNDQLCSFQQDINNENRNEAINNRSQQINFPKPTQEYLNEYAVNCIKSQKLSELIPNLFEGDMLNQMYQEELTEALKNKNNFRDVEKTIEQLLFKWVKKSISNEAINFLQ